MSIEEELGYYFLLVFVYTIAYSHYIALIMIILILLGQYIKYLKKKKKNGKILRRSSWESHQKCKALDFFGDWVVIFVKEKNNKISDEDFNSIINGAFIMVEKSFNDLRNQLEEINAGEFLHDDWEMVE